ncbi:MAG: prepilin-type N-terminal cleavage/methylation domain-containing protein [Deltaproteobacteria bacterium]|nr:MAG: prepilin-type N-terminal cleavage/methylation domain-containing protein [Deltaproteobacteria bacterium]
MLAKKIGKAASRGMTLIEIMVVLVILGLIAGAIGYNVFERLKDAQRQTATLDLKSISNGVDLYHVETGQWPESLQQLVPKFLKDVHKDPWGVDYVYVKSGDGYDVYSYGPDKAQGGGDDIVIHGGEGAAPPTAGK